MKKIEWHKVTWYSKALSVLLALYILCFGFYLGAEFKQWTIEHPEFRTEYFSIDKNINNINVNIDIWNTYKNDTYGLSFRYPKEWQIRKDYIANKDTPEEEARIVLGPQNGKSYFELVIEKDTGFDPASIPSDRQGIIGGVPASFDKPGKVNTHNIEIPHSYFVLAGLVKDNFHYSFRLVSIGTNDDMIAGDYAVMRGMLMTFRFTGKDFIPEAFTSPKDYGSASKKNLLHIAWNPNKIDASTIYLIRLFAEPGENTLRGSQIYKRDDLNDPVSKLGKFDWSFDNNIFDMPTGMYRIEIYSYGERQKLVSGEFLLRE